MCPIASSRAACVVLLAHVVGGSVGVLFVGAYIDCV